MADGGGSGGWGNLEGIIDVGVEHVIHCTVYVARCVIVVFWRVKVAVMRSVCLRVYGTMVVPSAVYIGGNLGTPVVVRRFSNFKSKGFGSMSEYMVGVSTKPAHPLTWDWGHAIRFSVRVK